MANRAMSLAELIDFTKRAQQTAEKEGVGLYHTDVIAVDRRNRCHVIIGAIEYDEQHDAVVFRIR